MTGREHRNFILVMTVVPPLGMLGAIVLLWNDLVGPVDLALFVIMYSITALGITLGYHRMLSHRSFKAKKPVRLALTTFGVLAAQGPPITWAAHHRKHHNLSDQEGDPHSPHLHGQEGIKGLLKGFWHAHLGWLFDEKLTSDPMRYVPDLVREKEMRWLSRHFLAIVLAGIIFPGVVVFAITQEPIGLLTGALWGGLARIFLLAHATYAVNSLGHIIGKRQYKTTDHSHNIAWLTLPAFGEAYHNNHHAFPNSAQLGHRRREIDLGWYTLRGLEKLGLVYDVVRPKERRIKQKYQPGAPKPPIPATNGHVEERELVGAGER